MAITETVPIPASEANNIMPEDLKKKPFFRKGDQDSDLYTPYFLDASAIDYDRRARLLAEAFPALTLPAGGNELVRAFGEPSTDHNFNMQTEYQKKMGDVVLWPFPGTRQNSRWLHNDVKDMAYVYTYGLFDKFRKIMEGIDQ